MFESNLDNFVASKVSPDGCILAALADDIGLVSLLPVHRETVFMTEDSHGLEGQLVCGTENADGNFASIGDEDLVQLHDGTVRPQASVHGVGILVGLAVGVRCAIVALVVLLRIGHGEEKSMAPKGRMTWLVARGSSSSDVSVLQERWDVCVGA